MVIEAGKPASALCRGKDKPTTYKKRDHYMIWNDGGPGRRVVESKETPFVMTGELTIEIPALPRPTLAELQVVFFTSRIKSIERDTSPIEPITLKLGTVFRPDEERIDGKEYERRLASNLDILLGYQHAIWLVEHQSEFPDFMAILDKKSSIGFPGLVAVDARDGRGFPCLGLNYKSWYLYRDQFEFYFKRNNRVAVSGK